MMNPEMDLPPENEAENHETRDWYGEKAKQKRNAARRAGNRRSFVFGVLATAVVVGGSIVIMLSQRVGCMCIGYATGYPAATLSSTPAPTDSGWPCIQGCSWITPVPDVPNTILADRLVEYHFTPPSSQNDLNALTQERTLPIKPLNGYFFDGIRVGPNGLLYVAHSHIIPGTDCDDNDGYWVVDPHNGTLVGDIKSPYMIRPKRIAFDSQGNAYVLGIDCHRSDLAALFAFNGIGQWQDTFYADGINDIVVSPDDRIFVSFGPYKSASFGQVSLLPPLIELYYNHNTRKLIWIGTPDYRNYYNSGYLLGYYSAIVTIPTTGFFVGSANGTFAIFGIWAQVDGLERYHALTVPPMDLKPPTFWTATTRDPHITPELDFITSEGPVIFGLNQDGCHIEEFTDYNGFVHSFPIPDITPTSFTIDSETQSWFFTGVMDRVPNSCTIPAMP